MHEEEQWERWEVAGGGGNGRLILRTLFQFSYLDHRSIFFLYHNMLFIKNNGVSKCSEVEDKILIRIPIHIRGNYQVSLGR